MPGAEVPEHVDIHYYWRTHLRIHIPVITNPDVGFTCAGETIHMPAGECWILDSFYRHAVVNRGSGSRGSTSCSTRSVAPSLWDLIDAANVAQPPKTRVDRARRNPVRGRSTLSR